MFINWKITDDLKNISLSEFNTEYNGIYGYIKLKIGENEIGELPNHISIEGDFDISYYIGQLINCGISFFKNENYSVMLLDSNLAEINVVFSSNVIINFSSSETKEIYWSSTITNKELIDEIEYNYKKFSAELIKTNPRILDSFLFKEIESKYNKYKSMSVRRTF